MDRIAHDLNLDRLEVRSRNFIRPDEFPWDVGLVYQDGGPTKYDSGDYQAGLEKLKALLDYDNFPAMQAEARARRALPGHRRRLLRGGHRHRAVRGRNGARGV